MLVNFKNCIHNPDCEINGEALKELTTDFEEFSALVTSPLARLRRLLESEISSGGSKDLEVRVLQVSKFQIGVILTHVGNRLTPSYQDLGILATDNHIQKSSKN